MAVSTIFATSSSLRGLRCILFLTLFLGLPGVTRTKQQDNFYFDPAPINQDVREGGSVTLRCDVSNRRHIAFYWALNDKPLANTSRRYQEDSDLRILRVNRDQDGGSFRCIATNVTTGVSIRSTQAILNILCKYIPSRYHGNLCHFVYMCHHCFHSNHIIFVAISIETISSVFHSI